MPHRFRASAALLVGALLLAACSARPDPTWRATTWADAPAWTAEIGGATAVVSATIGRLVWYGPTGGTNLLYLPPGGSVETGGAFLHGGHQCWLGPQQRWRWPPPAAWETSAAAATAAGAVLTLQTPDGGAQPGFLRTYRLTPDGLAIGVRWRDPERAWLAMHILQVPAATRIAPVRLTPSATYPLGASFDVEGKGDILPAGCRIDGERMSVQPTALAAKLFLPAQPLAGELDGVRFRLLPPVLHGREAGPAERGYPTQIWLPRTGLGYLELEQCSVMVAPGDDGWAGVEFTLQLDGN